MRYSIHSQGMKKTAVIVAILIALVAIMGNDRISQVVSILISDDKSPGSKEAESPLPRGRLSSTSSRLKNQPNDIDYPATENSSVAAPERTIVKNTADISNAIPGSITGKIGNIHFIRSATILGTSKPTPVQISRLQEAVTLVAEKLNSDGLILDTEGSTSSEIPFVLYARDTFDLTIQTKSIYDSLDPAPSLSLEENAQPATE
jgi:hypothetical protein